MIRDVYDSVERLLWKIKCTKSRCRWGRVLIQVHAADAPDASQSLRHGAADDAVARLEQQHVASGMYAHFDFADQMQSIMFMKNISMAGGLLILAAFGPGAFSLERAKA